MGIDDERLLAQRRHRYILSTFIYLLVLGLIHLPLNSYSLIISESSWSTAHYRRIFMITSNVTLIGLYAFGLFVLDQRSRTGLLVFAWLVVILDVTATMAVLYLFFSTISPRGASPVSGERWIGSILSVCLSIATLLIVIVSIKHVHCLSKLIKEIKPITTVIEEI